MKTTVTGLASGLVTLVVLGLIITGQSYARIDPEAVVGAWRFDDGRGDNARDSSGNGNDGNLDAIGWGAPKWVEGRFGKGLQFDGVNNYVDSGDDKSLTLIDAGKFTYTAWFKPDVVDVYQVLLALGVGGATPNTGDVRTANGKVFAYWHGEKGRDGFGVTGGTTKLELETWYHVAVVFVSGDSPVIYLNGKNENAGDAGGGQGQVFAGEGWKAWIGRSLYNDHARLFKGVIDEVGLFNVVLTEGEINELMEKGLGEFAAVSPSDKLATTWSRLKEF